MNRRQRRPNLRPVRGITADTVRALLGLRHAGTDCAYLPLERVRLADQVKVSAPAPCIDPADVPATLRDDCDSFPATPVRIGFDRGREGAVSPALRVPEAAPNLTPSVAQPAPSADCDDEARSAGSMEPTAPAIPAPIDRACTKRPDGPTIEDEAYAAAVAKELRAGRKDDRPDQTGADHARRFADPEIANRPARRFSRQIGPGTAARSAGQDGERDAAAPELKATRIDMIRDIAARLDQRSAPAPCPIAAPRIERQRLADRAPDPLAQRREQLAQAIRWLKARCILVDVTDRTAQIRKYRVSGKRELMLAGQVIEHAQALGMGEQG